MLNVLQIGYTGQIMLAVTQNVASALSMPGWLWLERRLGKRNANLIGISILSVTSLGWLLADANTGTAELVLRGIAQCAGSGGMILLSISVLSDTLA